jgi:hypothetical protein
MIQPNPLACCIGMLSLCQRALSLSVWVSVVQMYCTLSPYCEVVFQWCILCFRIWIHRDKWIHSEAANNFGLAVIHDFANLVSSDLHPRVTSFSGLPLPLILSDNFFKQILFDKFNSAVLLFEVTPFSLVCMFLSTTLCWSSIYNILACITVRWTSTLFFTII